MNHNEFVDNSLFKLENGGVLNGLTIRYHSYGKLNEKRDNIIWVFHALTANSDCKDWWNVLFGEGNVLDESKYFIVCANILGSCYGTSGPLSVNPETNQPYFSEFPQVTIRDMVRAHQLLAKHLGITKIKLGIGGSMGGYQLLEWNVYEPMLFEKIALLTTAAKESAWGIAIHTAQRMAIEADTSWKEHRTDAGRDGIKAARAIGMLTYRGYEAFNATQTDDQEKLDNFKASSYIIHQGNKLADRFNVYSYWLLTKAMDSHNIARGRAADLKSVLNTIQSKTIVIGIDSDILCPTAEQKYLAENINNSRYFEITSEFGHDGFLVEGEKIKRVLISFLNE